MQQHVHTNHNLAGLYPFVGVAYLIICLPFVFFIGFSSEFDHTLEPLSPSGYLFLMKRVLAASATQSKNAGKVSGKDL